jgi:hypothetical protein
MEEEKVLHAHDQGGLVKCRVGALPLHKGMGPVRGTSGCVWFFKMKGGISGRCMVCMGDGVETVYIDT